MRSYVTAIVQRILNQLNQSRASYADVSNTLEKAVSQVEGVEKEVENLLAAFRRELDEHGVDHQAERKASELAVERLKALVEFLLPKVEGDPAVKAILMVPGAVKGSRVRALFRDRKEESFRILEGRVTGVRKDGMLWIMVDGYSEEYVILPEWVLVAY